MIKVLIILIVLVLSGIFAYLGLSKKKGSPTPTVVPGPSSESQESGKEEVTPEIIEKAQDIQTEPPEPEPEQEPEPEPEDPGTCETTGDWAMSGECQADGTAIFTQTYKESKPGACPSSEKARVKPCCYQKGDWTDTTGCNERGRKTQKQTTVNCAENFKTREVDCPYLSPWRKTGGCNSAGKQYYIRDVVNSSEPKEKSENCCYTSAWGGWTPIGDCNGSTRPHQRTRSAINCPSGTSTSETKNLSCNHCQGAWSGWGGWGGWTGSTSCGKYQKRYRHRYYRISKNATNGGNPCPHSNNKKDTETDHRFTGHCASDGCFSSDTKLKLENGTTVNIKDIMLGDVLEGGITVNVTMQIRNKDRAPYYKVFSDEFKDYIYVTGSHHIKEGEKFVRVENCSNAEITDIVDDVWFCLITSNHNIPIGGLTFWDWADWCDACNKNTIPDEFFERTDRYNIL